MVCCFAAGGWLLLKPALRPSAAVASTESAKPWTTKAIEDVKVGDLVLARDEHGAEIGWKPVKEVYRRTSKHLRHLTFRDASGKEQHFETTDEHPFWSLTAKKFVNAGDLKTGDQVTSAPPRQGNPDLDHPSAIQILTATHRDEHPNGITVYNFQVEDFHTYFVAARGATGPPVLVHNASHTYNGVATPDQVLDAAVKHLGPGYRDMGNGRYLSADGMRQFRMGSHELKDPNNIHVHFEAYDNPGGLIIDSTFTPVR